MSLVDDEKSARGDKETKSRRHAGKRKATHQRYTENVKGEDCWERNVDAKVESKRQVRLRGRSVREEREEELREYTVAVIGC